MFGFYDHLDLAKAWGDMAVDCMETAAQASLAMLAPFAQSRSVFTPPTCTAESQSSSTRVKGWSSTSTEPGPASWYREPSRSPFEPWFGLAWSMPTLIPTAAFAPQQTMLGMLQPFQAWARLLSATSPAVPMTPVNWMSWPASTSLPMTALPWMSGVGLAMGAPAPGPAPTGGGAKFATYRSDSGHAVAQITFPNDVVAAVAVPPGAAGLFDAFWPWARTYDWSAESAR